MQREPFGRSIKKIRAIGVMKPGWNGFKGAVASEDVRTEAIDFLRDMGRQFSISIHEPTIVAPTPDGGVLLEWRLADSPKALELVFLPLGAHEWALREKERTIDYREEASRDDFVGLVKQHVAGRTTVILQ